MGMTPFMYACERNNEDIISFLIDCGLASSSASTSQKHTALHVAARYANTAVLKVLVNKMPEINVIDEFGLTPLFWACRGNKLETVKFLISNGACVNIKSKENWNILHMAAVCADNELIKYLIEHKVSLTDVDNKNRTPLSLAYEIKREDTIKFLLLNGGLLRPIDISSVGIALCETAMEKEYIKTESQNSQNTDNLMCESAIYNMYSRAHSS